MAVNNFSQKVMQMIQAIPRGKVATYGQIAALAGKVHGARGVSWILHSSSQKQRLPWQRVVNGKGMISFPEMSESYFRQKNLLEKEGVLFTDGRIDLKKFGWEKKAKKEKLRLPKAGSRPARASR